MEFCKECQEKFEARNGDLPLFDMCEDCQTKLLLFALTPDESVLH